MMADTLPNSSIAEVKWMKQTKSGTVSAKAGRKTAKSGLGERDF
jgi:hypothetical protein